MKSAFITGGTGFVGLNLIQQLVCEGWRVTALHRPSSDVSDLLAHGVQLRQGSVGDPESLYRAIPENVDVVFHVAANTSFWSQRNSQQTADNVDGTRNMVRAARVRRAKRFVCTSSVGAYGLHPERITEETVSNAQGSWVNYIRTKWLAEQEVRAGIAQGLDAVILNPCNILGPHDYRNWSQMFTLINQGKLPGVPSGGGSFCHVREVCKAHITAARKGRSGHNYLLAGTDASYHELARQVSHLLRKPKSPKVIPSALLRAIGHGSAWASQLTRQEPAITPEKALIVSNWSVASSAKAERELGYRAVPLSTGLRDCHEWLKSSGRL